MKKRVFMLLMAAMTGLIAMAQDLEAPGQVTTLEDVNRTPEPFMYSVTTLTSQDLKWSMHYAGSYGQNVEGPFGYEGVSQQIAVKGYLGNRLTLLANASLGIPNEGGNVTSAQQVEVIRDLIGGKRLMGLRIGLGLGVSNDFSNAKSLLSRLTLAYDMPYLKLSGNALFEHTFLKGRDPLDVIINLGAQYCVAGNLYAGLEAVGQDLEGFWETDEAEGGAKMLVGPSLSLAPKKSRLSFSLCGGPEIRATHSQMTNPYAIRELPVQSGFVVMGSVIFNLQGS
ncbi:hypothetical protein [Microbacter margulisiae]|uniref:Uncharacterized protein n=1 Tax=Microbacter margulisiae TaxID=1350067 RepID=A0A7W5H3C1_9PORP|nr:hypothetical protein [Microbacter margulisiae]MBB3188316.1 hypothetical protein [Microbacter margulisiae]